MAGICYLSSAMGLMIYKFIKRNKEAKIAKEDILNIFIITISGGVIAPILLFKAIVISNATTISVLLNFEMIFTAILATLFFRESSDRRFWFAVFLIFVASIFISINSSSSFYFSQGSFYAIFACLFWAIDNNFTTKLSLKDPYSIAIIKGLGGGIINIFFYFLASQKANLAPPLFVFSALIGIFCYGASFVFLIYSMRYVGASKSITIFGTYPIFSFLFSIIILKEKITPLNILSFLIMAAGIYLIISLKHSHRHTHQREFHEHLHSHNDGHHTHKHEGLPENITHSHSHFHQYIEHEHQHYDDIHHKHH